MTRFCNSCGQAIPDNCSFCTNCGAPVPPAEPQPQQQYYNPQPAQQQPMGQKPMNFLALAILATIFCCLPFGIVAIVQAAKVNNLWDSGHYAEAQDASRKARNWTIISAVVGLVVSIAYTLLVMKGVVAAGNAWSDILLNQ